LHCRIQLDGSGAQPAIGTSEQQEQRRMQEEARRAQEEERRAEEQARRAQEAERKEIEERRITQLQGLQNEESRRIIEMNKAHDVQREQAVKDTRATEARRRAEKELASCVRDADSVARMRAQGASQDKGNAGVVDGRCPICTLKPPCKHNDGTAGGFDNLDQAMLVAAGVPEDQRLAGAKEHFKKGRALRAQWEDDLALEEFRIAILLDPTYKEAHCHRGAVLLANERARSATRAFRAAIAACHEYKEAHLYLGCALVELVEYEDALDEFRTVLAMDPKQSKAHYHLARCLHTMGCTGNAHASTSSQLLADAIKHYKEALRLDPKHKDTYFHLGRALEVQEGVDSALPQLRMVVRMSPDDGEFQFVLGQMLASRGDLEEGISHYREAAALSPDEFEVQLTFAEALLQQSGGTGNLCTEAIQAFLKAIALNPHSALAHFKCGLALKALGRVDEAEPYFAKARELDPSYSEGGGNTRTPSQAKISSLRKSTDGNNPMTVNRWSVDEVVAWLESTFAFAADYLDAFTKLRVDGATLLTISEEELKNDLGVGVKMHSRRMLDEIYKLKLALEGNGARGGTKCMTHTRGPARQQLAHLGPPEALLVYSYCAVTRKWRQTETQVRIAQKSFSKGAMRAAHYMEDLSALPGGPQRFKVAKMYMKEESSTEGVMRRDVQIQEVARSFADAYNQNAPPKQVTFLTAQYGVRQQVQNDASRYVAIEMYLPGEYIKFNSNADFVMRSCDANYHMTPQAFSHFTWEYSNHTEIVVDIQGVNEYYTDPQIHTVTGEGYGEGNLGKAGINAFFSKHKCNEVCRYLGLPPVQQAPPKHVPLSMIAGRAALAVANAISC